MNAAPSTTATHHPHARAPLSVAVLFDTAGFLHSLPLTGAAVRTARLTEQLHQLTPTTLVLCDLNPRSRPTDAWPFPVRYVEADTMYERPDALVTQLRDLRPDVLVVSTTQLLVRHGHTLARELGCALIYEMHDNEARLVRSLGHSDDEHDTRLLQATAMRIADGVIAFTDRDAEAARSLGARTVHIVPCGAEPPTPAHSSGQTHRPRIAFVGNCYYEPNLRALRFLSEVVAPTLDPHVGIDVFGRYPDTARRYATPPVTLHGPVPDLRAALQTATIGIAPLDAGGGGMKLKMLEYRASGLPVVATPEALVGLDQPQTYALISTDPAMRDIPQLVDTLLRDPRLRDRLGTAGRERHYSWSHSGRLAADAYAAIAAHRRTTPRAALSSRVRQLAERPPFWLAEYRSHTAERTALMDQPGAHEHTEALDCARIAAESALGTRFDEPPVTGYGGRSHVYLAPETVLKIYTHRARERCDRERAGITVAQAIAGIRVPTVLAHDAPQGALAWLACTRLDGQPPTDAQLATHDTAALLGHIAARLHTLPPVHTAPLATHQRRIRPPSTSDPDAHAAATEITTTLAPYDTGHRARCSRSLVHGDFSSRNILLGDDQPGVIDWEGAGVGCAYDDLAALLMQDGLLGPAQPEELIAGYNHALRTLAPASPGITRSHLLWHLAWRARWILQWSPDIDPPLTTQVLALVPDLLTELAQHPHE